MPKKNIKIKTPIGTPVYKIFEELDNYRHTGKVVDQTDRTIFIRWKGAKNDVEYTEDLITGIFIDYSNEEKKK